MGGKVRGTGICGDVDAAFDVASALSDARIPRPALREYLSGAALLGLSISLARAGYSGTLSDVACWFAMRFAEPGRKPLVPAAEVPGTSIGAVLDERNEAESVLMRPRAARAEGTPDEWQKRYEAVAAANRAAMYALVHRLEP